MTKDITRFLHQPAKQYAGVRLQQGRPLLDSDFNEGARLREDNRREVILDIFGPHAAADAGFTFGRPFELCSAVPADTEPLVAGETVPVHSIQLNGEQVFVHAFTLRPGSAYVGGLRFDLGEPEHIAFQRDYLQMKPGDVPPLELLQTGTGATPEDFGAGGELSEDAEDGSRDDFTSPESTVKSPDFPEFRNFYFLHAWEQCVTAVEDDELREAGLAGPDTSVRIKRMRRVEIRGELPEYTNCTSAFEALIAELEQGGHARFNRSTCELESLGRLQLVFQQPLIDTDCPPCTPDPGARYTGTENQAFRILLTSPTTFVWANDNAAPLYRIKVTGLSAANPDNVTVTLLTPAKDHEHLPRTDRVVEILPFAAILEGAEGLRPNDPHFQKIADEVGVFLRVGTLHESGKSFDLDLTDSSRIQKLRELVTRWDDCHPAAQQLNIGADGDTRYFYMRTWHSATNTSGIELPISSNPNGSPLGRTGVIPVFHHTGLRGDFWTATLRVDARDRIVPFDLLTESGGVSPHGPHHYYSPLGILEGVDQVLENLISCRRRARPIVDRGCATLIVGDGVNSIGDYESIQEAVNALPIEGGLIEVRPGNYIEQVVITNRANVVIRGCGASSLLQAPAGSSGRVVEISHSDSCTLADLQIHAPDQIAVEVLHSQQVSLLDLRVFAGGYVSSEFVPDGDLSGSALVILGNSLELQIVGGQFYSGRDSFFHGHVSTGMEIRGVEVVGPSNATTAPSRGMISTTSFTTGLVVEDCTLRSYSQYGVEFRSIRTELRRLTIDTGVCADASSHTRAAIFTDSGRGARVEDCRVTMDSSASEDAAVVLGGDDMDLDGCFVETLFDTTGNVWRAWGGVQIRGGSTRVRVRRNRIVGGLGHGITLGSATFAGIQRPAGYQQIEQPASVPYVSGDMTGTDTPTLHGRIDWLTIADNHIERMGTNGISALTTVGAGDYLVEVQRTVIERNTITSCVRQVAQALETPRTDVLPFGSGISVSASPPKGVPLSLRRIPYAGIALGVASVHLDVRDNVITGNAPNEPDAQFPFNGIFVLIGDAIVITGNRIEDNGERANFATNPPQLGVRAGIAVLLAGTGSIASIDVLRDQLGLDGASVDFQVDNAGSALQVTDNHVAQVEGRALHLVAAGPVNVDGNFLSSQGNHFPSTTPAQYDVGDVVLVENLGAPWELHHPQTTYDDAVSKFQWFVNSAETASGSPRFFLGFGGPILFQNNQVVYDWSVVSPIPTTDPLSFFPVMVMSLDHVGANNNQFAMRHDLQTTFSEHTDFVEGFPVDTGVYSHGFFGGTTVELVDNRFAESVHSTYLSALAAGEMLTTVAFNQSTHAIIPICNSTHDPYSTLVEVRTTEFRRSPQIPLPGTVPEHLYHFFDLVFHY